MSRILLIDDDTPLRDTIAEALTRAGHTVDQAADGRAGLNHFRAEAPDLVITDLIMPNCEGLEMITTLRREAPAVPIIAMSGGGFRNPHYLDVARKLGAQRTLAKPFSPADLLAAVDELLRPPASG